MPDPINPFADPAGMDPAVQNRLIQAGLMPVPPGVAEGWASGTSPVEVGPLPPASTGVAANGLQPGADSALLAKASQIPPVSNALMNGNVPYPPPRPQTVTAQQPSGYPPYPPPRPQTVASGPQSYPPLPPSRPTSTSASASASDMPSRYATPVSMNAPSSFYSQLVNNVVGNQSGYQGVVGNFMGGPPITEGDFSGYTGW